MATESKRESVSTRERGAMICPGIFASDLKIIQIGRRGICDSRRGGAGKGKGEREEITVVLESLAFARILQEIMVESLLSAVCSEEIPGQTLVPEGFKTKNTAVWDEDYSNPMCTH